jgi:putative ABC transport system permease protein
MNIVSQILAVTAMNLRSIPQRLGNSLVIVVGIAGVVAVLISVLAMYLGFRTTIDGDASAERVIVLSRGASAENESGLSRENVAAVMNAAGIKHDAQDRPVVSAELILVAPVARKRDNSDVYVTLRGVGPQYFVLRPELKLVSGRMFRAGNQELLVGASAGGQFVGLEIGSRVRLQDGDWTVVGTFAGGNGSRESEVIADAQTVMSAYKIDAFNSVSVLRASGDGFATLKTALAEDSTVAVDVRTEPEYLATASGSVNRMLQLVAYSIGSIMALGALFGALNSMHSAVAARTVEIATLRAIGFTSLSVAIAVLIEALLLALAGAMAGAAIAYGAFNGSTISTLGGAVWDSQLVYSLNITPSLVVIAIVLACVLGLLGGLFPAIRAARSSVADAFHER